MDDEDNGEILGDFEIAIMTLTDQPRKDALAIAECWIRADFAWATDCAIAEVPPVADEAPFRDISCLSLLGEAAGIVLLLETSSNSNANPELLGWLVL